ncbi:hypothetical protein ABPG74_016582 [Tetrahymena malaccensis]
MKSVILSSNCCEKIGIGLKFLKDLQFLKLSIKRENAIQNDGLIYVSQGLQNLQQLKQLKIVISENNQINYIGISAFSKCLNQLTNLYELSIQIYSNPIQNEGLRDLASSISNLIQLNSLKIKLIKSDINDDSLIFLGQNITLLSQLQKLRLSIYEQKNQIINGIYELFQSTTKLKNLNFLKFQANFQHSKDIDFNINFSQSLKQLKHIRVLKLSIPYLEQEKLFIQVQDQQNFLQLMILNIQFNHALTNEELSIFSFNLKMILNLQNLIINIKKNIKRDEKSQLNIQGVSALLENLGQCQKLKHLNLNTETEYDYIFLRLLSQSKQIQSMSLFRNVLIGFKRNQNNNDIIELYVPFKNSMGKYNKMNYLKYMIESLQYFDKLTTLKISFNEEKFIELEKTEIVTKTYDENLKKNIFFSVKQLKQTIKDQISILINEIQKQKSIKYFEISFSLYQYDNFIYGQRLQDRDQFSIKTSFNCNYQYSIEPLLLFITQSLIQISQYITQFSVIIYDNLRFTLPCIQTLGSAIKQMKNLTIAKVILKGYLDDNFERYHLDKFFIGLKNLKYYKLYPSKYKMMQKSINKLKRKNLRLVYYK